MRALLVIVLFATLNASAQTLPVVPHESTVPLLPKHEQPKLGGFIAPVLFGTLLCGLFTVSTNPSANDIAPATFGFGLGVGLIGLGFEINAAKRKRRSLRP